MTKKRLKSLDQLRDLKPAKPQKKQRPYPFNLLPEAREEAEPESAPEAEEQRREDDAELFLSAMSGATPLDGESGRQVTPKPKARPPREMESDDAVERYLRGDIEFELEHGEEYMHGYVRGLDSKVFQKLKAGALSMEAHVDLHGMNAEQAYEALLFFLRESYLQGRRGVLVVTGRGKGSPGGMSVLKSEIKAWLTREPLRRVVLAFCTAQQRDGGAGALYVLLRRFKKGQGKVRWDSLTQFES